MRKNSLQGWDGTGSDKVVLNTHAHAHTLENNTFKMFFICLALMSVEMTVYILKVILFLFFALYTLKDQTKRLFLIRVRHHTCLSLQGCDLCLTCNLIVLCTCALPWAALSFTAFISGLQSERPDPAKWLIDHHRWPRGEWEANCECVCVFVWVFVPSWTHTERERERAREAQYLP